MRASEESTEQRLDRWQDLRDHLRDYGLHKKPPDDLLLEPEPATRPNVRLVAYYDKIKQESMGKKTVTEMLTTVLAVVLSVRVLTGFDRWFDDSEQPVTLGWLILTLVMLVFTYVVVGWILRKIRSRKDSLSLNWEELSLSLPDGNRHVPWHDVHSAIDIQRRKRFSRRKPYVRRAVKPCIRVELNDGVVARLYVDEIDCQPLAHLMTDFLLCARNGGQPLCERAAAPEAAN